MLRWPDSFFNIALAKAPMNWGIVWAIATLWLLLFHVLMQAWGSFAAAPQGAFGAPGQIAAPVPDVTSLFSQPGSLASTGGGAAALSSFVGGGLAYGDGTWADAGVSRFAEDGWTGNP